MYTTAINQDTIVALATPQGQGAIGVLRLSGKDAIAITDSVFAGKDLADEPANTVHFGTIRDSGKVVDEVVVTLFKAPRSYTGEDVVEISCHGSSYIQQQLIQLLVKHGARLAEPGEYTLRAFLNGKMDLSQAEAVADLIAADSESAHATALRQLRGGYSSELKELRQQLIHFASMVELELDFAEEDVEFADRTQLVDLIMRIRRMIQLLMESFRLGNAIKNGVTTVIAGRPNAGKSTLLNALLKEERAIVSEIPGTTRDTIEEVINMEGILFRLVDTAGIRDAADKIEAIGVQKTMEKIRQSALVVYVFDVNELSKDELEQDLKKLEAAVPVLIVGNKIDVHPDEDFIQHFERNDIIYISSKSKENLDELKQHLVQSVTGGKLLQEQTIVTNARHFSELQKADKALEQVLQGIEMGISGELLALDIKTALSALGTITGDIDVDRDILGTIFSKFCIGK